MGFWSRWFGFDTVPTVPFDTYDPAQRVLPDPYEPYYGSIPVADPGYALAERGRSAVESLWKSQPNVRKVVDFIARNVASIPLHAYERVSDTDRQRLTDHPLAEVTRTPRSGVAPYRFWHAVISDGLLYDRWAAIKAPREDGLGVELVRVPAWRLRLHVDALSRIDTAWYWVGDRAQVAGDQDGWRPLDLDMLVVDHGYAPNGAGLSPLETLADVLAETAEAVAYRRQVWRNGARVPAWIERPLAAPDWSGPARDRFKAGFRSTYTGDGPGAGGAPLLEDGMQLHEFNAYSPQDTQDLEGRRLSAIEVAAAYHIAPELVGAQQGNYSNVKEYRQMLYRDSLGPYIVAWEGVLNAQLVPELAGTRHLYVEANVESKLRGSFEEQASVKQSATGAPWLTRNEARALENRPPVAGGDDLVVPLNVLVGGQASPRDSAPKHRRGLKARADETVVEKATQVLAAFFDQQGRALVALAGTGGVTWDDDRWNTELAAVLLPLNALIATDAGRQALELLGVDPAAWDEGMVLAWLGANALGVAQGINDTTRVEVESALVMDDAGDPAAAVAGLFAGVVAARAAEIATTQVSAISGFGTIEAVKQSGMTATKTWKVRSGNPRPSHARMRGQTVPVGELFSNGARWPGDSTLPPDERAGCTCDIDVTVEA